MYKVWYNIDVGRIFDFHQGGVLMSAVRRYGKPSMTNLPPELGKTIFNQIRASKVPNRDKMHQEAARLENEMRIALERRKNEKR